MFTAVHFQMMHARVRFSVLQLGHLQLLEPVQLAPCLQKSIALRDEGVSPTVHMCIQLLRLFHNTWNINNSQHV